VKEKCDNHDERVAKGAIKEMLIQVKTIQDTGGNNTTTELTATSSTSGGYEAKIAIT
jgi:hypothetical protein